jgi:hypothetical protein
MGLRAEIVTLEKGADILRHLRDVRVIGGRYDVRVHPDKEGELIIANPGSGPGEYEAVTGSDRTRGRVTLLKGNSHCVVIRDGIARPWDDQLH